GAEEHGDLPVGRVTMIIGGFPGISRGKSLNTWHHVKRANTVAAPSRKDLRQESPDYCQKPVKLGNLSTDGTKMGANASRHKAMSYGYMNKEINRLKAEIEQLLKQAEQIDAEQDAALGSRRGDEL